MNKIIDSFSFNELDKSYIIEYNGWHFEGKTIKSVINKVLRYIRSVIK